MSQRLRGLLVVGPVINDERRYFGDPTRTPKERAQVSGGLMLIHLRFKGQKKSVLRYPINFPFY